MQEFTYSALIVAGGRSSRLGGVPKALLSNGSRTLLEGVLEACQGAEKRVLVGPAYPHLPPDLLITREEPVLSGPAAAISAGLKALAGQLPDIMALPQHWILLLSCDLPRAGQALPFLLAAAHHCPSPDTAGYWAVSDGVKQPLLGIYRAPALLEAFSADTANRSVRRFLTPLQPQPVEIAAHLTTDIDTWERARAEGFTQIPGKEFL